MNAQVQFPKGSPHPCTRDRAGVEVQNEIAPGKRMPLKMSSTFWELTPNCPIRKLTGLSAFQRTVATYL